MTHSDAAQHTVEWKLVIDVNAIAHCSPLNHRYIYIFYSIHSGAARCAVLSRAVCVFLRCLPLPLRPRHRVISLDRTVSVGRPNLHVRVHPMHQAHNNN